MNRAPNPTCPVCQGIGFVEEPYYSDFAPTTRPVLCPSCQPGRRKPTGLILAILTVFAIVIGFLMGCMS